MNIQRKYHEINEQCKMKKIYRKIAKQYGVTAEEVRGEIQNALNAVYEKSEETPMADLVKKDVPKKGSVPTTDEFILYASKKVKNKLSEDS